MRKPSTRSKAEQSASAKKAARTRKKKAVTVHRNKKQGGSSFKDLGITEVKVRDRVTADPRIFGEPKGPAIVVSETVHDLMKERLNR